MVSCLPMLSCLGDLGFISATAACGIGIVLLVPAMREGVVRGEDGSPGALCGGWALPDHCVEFHGT